MNEVNETTVNTEQLQAQLAELQAQLEAAKAVAKEAAIDEVVALMQANGITTREISASIKADHKAAVAARKEARAKAKAEAEAAKVADPEVLFNPVPATGETSVVKAGEVTTAPF